MFRAYRAPVPQTGNTIANGINQFVDTDVGRAFMYLVGTLTVIYGAFALMCTRYRYFPTPPPSGIPLFYRFTAEDGAAPRASVVINNQTHKIVDSDDPKFVVGETMEDLYATRSRRKLSTVQLPIQMENPVSNDLEAK